MMELIVKNAKKDAYNVITLQLLELNIIVLPVILI